MSALGLVCQASFFGNGHKTVYIHLPVKHHFHIHTVYKHIYHKASEDKSKADEHYKQEAAKDDSSAHNGDVKIASQGEKHKMEEKSNGLEHKPTHDKAPAVKPKTVQYIVYEPSQEDASSAHNGYAKSISQGGIHKMEEKYNGLEHKPTHDKAPAVKPITFQYAVYEPSQEDDSLAHSGDAKSTSQGDGMHKMEEKSYWY
jgi:hypothetical protein